MPAIGILVGGQGRRMGGVAKGNLLFEGRSILDRTLQTCRGVARSAGSAAAAAPIYLVGESTAYSASGVLRLADDPTGVGPMGGLRAFLREAQQQGLPALALAVDLPFLTAALLARLCFEAFGVAALAPREAGRWQPLFARYLPDVVLPELNAALAEQRTSLQEIFDRLGSRVVALELSAEERQALRDWDQPGDLLLPGGSARSI